MNSRLTVLLVEDNPSFRKALEAMLRRQGHDVIAVGDGRDACDWLAGGDLPDLVVVDMMTPGASGFVVCGHVKDLSDHRVPVIMTSGLTAAAHREYAYACGADVFLAKPFRAATLLDAVHALCPAAGAVARPLVRIGRQLASS